MEITSETRIIDMTAGQLEEFVSRLIEQRKSTMQDPQRPDETITGMKAICSVVGVSKSTFYETGLMDVAIKDGAVYHVGRVTKASRDKLIKFRDKYLINK